MTGAVVTDTDMPRRLRNARNLALLMLGVTVAGYASEPVAWGVLTLNCLVWFMWALEKVAQLRLVQLAQDEAVQRDIVKRN